MTPVWNLFPGVSFSSEDAGLEELCRRAARELSDSVMKLPATGESVLMEGLDYQGAWLESTGSICAQTLARFLPRIAGNTMRAFALHAREDGLLPYKILPSGPAFRQIQMVSPLARAVRIQHALSPDPDFLRLMYDAMTANDHWLARHRDTRRTGCVEAFCTFDTGHDLSPRFWHLPDTCHDEDPARYDPSSPLLPLVAPDLTANCACQRRELSAMAAELGEHEDARLWKIRAEHSESSLFEHCFDPEDEFFYDRTASGALHKIQSDVLLRVFACGIGDDRLFDRALGKYLLNTGKFLSSCGFASIAMDDPRFDPDASRNSWAGPVNTLSLLRSPDAFELHGRQVELVWVLKSFMKHARRFKEFPQCLDPWSGDAGFGKGYTPAMLAVLDCLERLSGILPRPEGTFSCSAVPASPSGRPQGCAGSSLYSRMIKGSVWSLLVDHEKASLTCDGSPRLTFPSGARLEVSADLVPLRITALVPQGISGRIDSGGLSIPVRLAGNQVALIQDGQPVMQASGGVIQPSWQTCGK